MNNSMWADEMQAVIVTKAKNEEFDEKCNSGRDFALFVWVAASNVWGGFDREVLSWPRVYKSSISPNLIMAGNFLGHFLPMIHTCKFCDKYVTKTQSQGYSHKGLACEQPVLLLGPAQPEKFLGPKNVWGSGCIRLSIRLKQYSLRGHNVFCSSGCFLFFSIDLWGWWTQQVSKHAMYYAMDYFLFIFFQFSSVQSLSHVWLFATPWTHKASLSITNSQSPCPSSQWCHPTISSSVIPFSSCLQSFPASGSFPVSQLFASGGQSVGVSASTSVLPMNTQDFRMDWLDLLAVQGTLKSFLQHHSSKTSILRCLAFFIVQLSHPYMTAGKTIALTRWTFVGKVMSLPFNTLSKFK